MEHVKRRHFEGVRPQARHEEVKVCTNFGDRHASIYKIMGGKFLAVYFAAVVSVYLL